jgi:hypothetical protein
MNNEVILSQLGRWMDYMIHFLFKQHLWLGILIIFVLLFIMFKFFSRPISDP